ncbi:MBL fold metallo-hydrolase [Geobacter sp.]|uniref:MBL fold metallo-hydrolase RNA specificity domain-containing protein n=1 Tax=Geobacter sp. TaxID=46610 RepID=UPI0026115752|nr:MBL fold metallo-hydrolase [Geobacter sp.]
MPSVIQNRQSPNIIHHGGRFGVTGSCHELQLTPSSSLLVDCGLFQGAEAASDKERRGGFAIDFPLENLQGVVLTHVHVDHCGRLPFLIGAGYRGPIYCTEATALLLPLVLEDALKLGVTRDEALVQRVVAGIDKRLVPLPYGEWRELGTWDGVTARIRLQPAGHILGSAVVEVEASGARDSGLGGGEGGTRGSGLEGTCRVVFSGDLGAPDTPLLPDPAVPERADILVLESTYGDRLHEERKDRTERLRQIIVRALKNRGALLIPAFSIGRTQELLYELEEIIALHRSEEATAGLPWDDLEVVVDSPMARRVTEVYRELQPLWDAEAKQVVAAGRHPLSFEQMTVIDSHEEHLQTVAYLKKTARPCIVIAAGGMCAGGRIVNYLKALLGDERTDLLFVGYQASGTPGREIREQGTGGGVELEGKGYRIRAGIHAIGGYSAHADRRNLVDFVKAIPLKPRLVRLVHGEEDARRALAAKLREEVGVEVEE